MTQSNESENIYESIKPTKKVNKKFINDKCVQTIAWMLLTIALCIIGYIIFLSVQSDDEKVIESKVIDGDRGGLEFKGHYSRMKKFMKRSRMFNDDYIYKNCNDFAMPQYVMSLTLYYNRTVKAVIEDFTVYQKFNIIWFYETTLDEKEEAFDYNCTAYTAPYLFIDIPLKENITYTFCILYRYKQTTSPCNCQPLYIPPKRQIIEFNDVESKDDDIKIGFLCLILLISAFTGAALGFLSIKTYPELLEGSKNVLVIHKSTNFKGNTESNYVEYTQSSKTNHHLSKSLNCTKRQSMTSPPKFEMYASWNFYSKSFPIENDYEMPCSFNGSLKRPQFCIPNTYTESPSSPPPSPKKKTNIKTLGVVNEAFE